MDVINTGLMNRIILIAVSVSVIFVSIFVTLSAFWAFDNLEKLNIIVILSDDLDVDSTNLLLERDLMPNLKKHIVDRGTIFTNSFVTTPNCCPSRSSFMTGQYPHNHGVLTNADIEEFNDSSTLSTWLHDSGYRTGFVGKYLNGYGTKLPESYIPPGWDYWQALVEKKVVGTPYQYSMYNFTVSNNGIPIKYGTDISDYQTDVLEQLSSKFILDSELFNEKKPFFLVISPFAPHADQTGSECLLNDGTIRTSQGPERYLGQASTLKLVIKPSFNETDTSDKPTWVQSLSPLTEEHYQCLEEVYQKRIEAIIGIDDLVGAVIGALEKTNELTKTVIIFTSDNGYAFGEHRLSKKGNVYEESIRVPLFIKAPGFFFPQSSDKLVINNDLAPTILEFANANSNINLDGRSLVPLLSNPDDANWRNKFLIEYWNKGIPPSFNAIRNTSNIYVEYENSLEFYDLQNDPYQLNNLYPCSTEKCKRQIDEFKKWLSNFKICEGENCRMLEN